MNSSILAGIFIQLKKINQAVACGLCPLILVLFLFLFCIVCYFFYCRYNKTGYVKPLPLWPPAPCYDWLYPEILIIAVNEYFITGTIKGSQTQMKPFFIYYQSQHHVVIEDKFIHYQLYLIFQNYLHFGHKNTNILEKKNKGNRTHYIRIPLYSPVLQMLALSYSEFEKWYSSFNAQKRVNWLLHCMTVLFSGLKLLCIHKYKNFFTILNCWILNYFILNVEQMIELKMTFGAFNHWPNLMFI